MRLDLVLTCLAAGLFQPSSGVVWVTILYETLCSDSQMFFVHQLQSAYKIKKVHDNIHVHLVPFGKASFVSSNKGSSFPWTVNCQHGPRECMGNVLDACFYARNEDNEDQVLYALCTMSQTYPPKAGELCAKYYNFDYSGVKKCSISEEGQQYQALYGKETQAVHPSFIPTVLINGEYNPNTQRQALSNLTHLLLEKIDEEGNKDYIAPTKAKYQESSRAGYEGTLVRYPLHDIKGGKICMCKVIPGKLLMKSQRPNEPGRYIYYGGNEDNDHVSVYPKHVKFSSSLKCYLGSKIKELPKIQV